MRNWVSSVMSHLRQYFGITNPQDVARMKAEIVDILGTKVFKGKRPFDFMDDVKALKIQYQTAETKSGYKALLKQHNRVRAEMNNLKKNFQFKEEQIRSVIKDELGVDTWTLKEGSKNSVNIDQLMSLETRLSSLVVNIGQGKSPKVSTAENKPSEPKVLPAAPKSSLSSNVLPAVPAIHSIIAISK